MSKKPKEAIYTTSDGKQFKSAVEAAEYLRKKIEVFCRDIYFIKLKHGYNINEIKDSADSIEYYLGIKDFIRFCETFPKMSIIYIKSDKAAKELTSLCKERTTYARGSKFSKGFNFYIKAVDKFLPQSEAQIQNFIPRPATEAIAQMQAWLDDNT